VVVGVVLEPARSRLTYASRGAGCWRVDGDAAAERCSVSATDRLEEATLTQSHSKGPASPSRPVHVLGPRRVIETYSAGIKLALVARGEADLYVNTYEAFSDWDICAGHILVEEAGGAVTGLGGELLHYGGPPGSQQSGLLASNGRIHQAAAARLKDR